MDYVDWMIKGPKIGGCSCDYGCPCEFMAPPTRRPCEGYEGMEIDEGYFGDVRLDGLRTAGVFRWPGAIHEGGGAYQPVIDKRATEQQVAALFKILGGEEQEPTQFGRARAELGVQQIFARSPQAKGRGERAAGTLLDRLVTELRLAGASTIAEANRVLWDYLPRFNQRFG